MPLVTFFSVLELPEKNRKGGCNNPPLVRRGLTLLSPYASYFFVTRLTRGLLQRPMNLKNKRLRNTYLV